MLMMGVAEVPIAIFLGALVFGERLTFGTIAGAACVLTGVVLGPVTAQTLLTGARESRRVRSSRFS